MDRLRPPEDYAVYVLECESPDSVTAIEDRAKNKRGMVPRYVYAALNSWTRLYVGSTGDIWGRLTDHVRREGREADFTYIFHPVSLYDVEWYTDRYTALERERDLAVELRQENGVFVYQE